MVEELFSGAAPVPPRTVDDDEVRVVPTSEHRLAHREHIRRNRCRFETDRFASASSRIRATNSISPTGE